VQTTSKKEIGPTQESYCHRSSKQQKQQAWQLPLQFGPPPPVEHGHGHGHGRPLVPLPSPHQKQRGSIFLSFPIHPSSLSPFLLHSIFVTCTPTPRPRFDSKTLLAAGCLISLPLTKLPFDHCYMHAAACRGRKAQEIPCQLHRHRQMRSIHANAISSIKLLAFFV